MKINYVVLLRNKQGVAYDVSLSSKHYNFTIKKGCITELVEINSDGDYKNVSQEDMGLLFSKFVNSKLIA